MRWECTRPCRGVPSFVRGFPARGGRARFFPRPLLPARCLCSLLGRGGASSSWALSTGGVPWWCYQWFPPVPPLRAAGVRCWVGGPPPHSSPWRPLALGERNRSGGGSPPSLHRPVPAPSLPSGGLSPPPPPDDVLRCVVWPHGRPPLPQALHWLGLPPTPPMPPCCTHGAGACSFQS